MSTPVLGGYCARNEGCSRYYKCRGMCSKHYRQWRKSSDYVPPGERPPVCVCNEPEPGVFGECKKCLRSAHVDNADFREAWRARLGLSSVDVVAVPPPATSTDFAAPAANEGASLAPGPLNLAST